MVVLELLFRNLFGFGDQLTRRNVKKHLEHFQKKKKHLECLLPPEVERKSWRINLEKFPPLPERRDAEHGFFRLLRTPSKPSSQILTTMMCRYNKIGNVTVSDTSCVQVGYEYNCVRYALNKNSFFLFFFF